MQNTREIALSRTRALTNFIFLAGIAILFPFFIHSQWLTGPIVNSILIITLFLVGIRSALLLCFVPSLVALSSGLLPVILAPVVPFIMLSNAILVLVLDWVYNNSKDSKNGYWLGLLIAASLKFVFLYSSVYFLRGLILKSEILAQITQMMSWPQFVTAILGGIIAWGILKKIKRL